MERDVHLIVNPASGGGRGARAQGPVESELRRLNVSFRTTRTTSIAHAMQLAREAVEADEVAATLGGDGLVGSVAGALAHTEGILAVLPGGRGNDFARALGIPADAREATAALMDGGTVREVDVAEADGKPFVGVASAGIDSDANRIANETKLIGGDLVYAYGGLRAIASWTPAHFQLELDDETISFSGCSFAAANSPYFGGGMKVAPDARLDDGRLDIVCGGRATRRRYVLGVAKIFRGTHVDSPYVRVFRSREFRVSADRPFTVYADGDPITELPAVIRVRDQALRVLVPSSSPAGR